jgi:hypothetical protein
MDKLNVFSGGLQILYLSVAWASLMFEGGPLSYAYKALMLHFPSCHHLQLVFVTSGVNESPWWEPHLTLNLLQGWLTDYNIDDHGAFAVLPVKKHIISGHLWFPQQLLIVLLWVYTSIFMAAGQIL